LFVFTTKHEVAEHNFKNMTKLVNADNQLANINRKLFRQHRKLNRQHTQATTI
jgi:hypothetical protein